jgi:hypothetical protein
VSVTTWAGIPPDEDTKAAFLQVNRAVVIDSMDDVPPMTTAHALARFVRVAGCAIPVR